MKADQVGALCVRISDDGTCQVLLVASRGTGRWIIPKGWRAKRLKDHEAAAREAEEEAGVSGKMKSKPIGKYAYPKPDDATMPALGSCRSPSICFGCGGNEINGRSEISVRGPGSMSLKPSSALANLNCAS